ncbi:MAG: (2Fe-2S)-binding protein [Pyrinomonadaceae bacterium]
MSFYPKKISMQSCAPAHGGKVSHAASTARSVSFICGVTLELSIEIVEGKIFEARFLTNGCGFVVAAADLICYEISGTRLKELHALEPLIKSVEAKFGLVDSSRTHCFNLCFEALENALQNYRSSVIEEFKGEKPLVCTCFGVDEEAVERAIRKNGLRTVEEVGETTNAGTGCGSCLFLLQEMIDSEI